MAFFPQTSPPPVLGQVLRDGLDDLRSAFYKLAWAKASFDQMTTDQQFADATGYALAQAATAKAELQADIGKLLNGDAGTTCAQMKSAVDQMLAQFG